MANTTGFLFSSCLSELITTHSQWLQAKLKTHSSRLLYSCRLKKKREEIIDKTEKKFFFFQFERQYMGSIRSKIAIYIIREEEDEEKHNLASQNLHLLRRRRRWRRWWWRVLFCFSFLLSLSINGIFLRLDSTKGEVES